MKMFLTVEFKNTRYGFKHVCKVYKGSRVIAEHSINYLNRTWEAYEYQSVIVGALRKAGLEELARKAALAGSVDKAVELVVAYGLEQEEV